MVTTQKVLKGQIYLAKLTGKGCEQRGKRPVLILQNNVGNKATSKNLFWQKSSM